MFAMVRDMANMSNQTQCALVRRARLRCASEHEVGVALGFWRLHPSPFLTARPVPMLRRAASHGRLLVIEECGHWAACAAAFEFGDMGVVELSDARVVEGLQGFRLQRDLLTPARIAVVGAGRYPADIIMIIDRTNSRSLENATQAGFEPYLGANEDMRAMLGLRPGDGQYELLRLPRQRAVEGSARLSQAIGADGTFEFRHSTRANEVLSVQVDMDVLHAPA